MKTLKNQPKKLHTYGSWEFIFSAALNAQNSREIHFCFIDFFIQPSFVGSLIGMLIFYMYIAAGSWLRVKKACPKQASQQVFGLLVLSGLYLFIIIYLANFSNPPNWKRHLLAANIVLKFFKFSFFFFQNQHAQSKL